MPITYPRGTVTWIGEGETIRYKLDRALTYMGYDKTEKLASPLDVDGKRFDYAPGFGETHARANTVVEGTCSINDVERI